MNKPFAPSADRNKEPILHVLKDELAPSHTVLEIGSGTGQHACHFASALPEVIWQPTELAHNIPAIQSWLGEYDLKNVLPPIVLDVDVHPWPNCRADVCFTSNTFHIVSLDSVRSLFKGCQQAIQDSGKLCVYGPFIIDGHHVSKSNEKFDQWLQESDPASGVRDLSELNDIARQFGFSAGRRIEMPANNFFVVWDVG